MLHCCWYGVLNGTVYSVLCTLYTVLHCCWCDVLSDTVYIVYSVPPPCTGTVSGCLRTTTGWRSGGTRRGCCASDTTTRDTGRARGSGFRYRGGETCKKVWILKYCKFMYCRLDLRMSTCILYYSTVCLCTVGWI